MKNFDYNKEFTCGNITITRNDYECMPCAMNTSSLSDEDMYRLAKAINDMMMIDAVKNTEYPKIKDMEWLKKIVKRNWN